MAGSTFSMIGSAKAAVLPEPVCDCPITSWPWRRMGMAADWMGEASSYPIFATALSRSGERPSSAKGSLDIRRESVAEAKRHGKDGTQTLPHQLLHPQNQAGTPPRTQPRWGLAAELRGLGLQARNRGR